MSSERPKTGVGSGCWMIATGYGRAEVVVLLPPWWQLAAAHASLARRRPDADRVAVSAIEAN